MLKDIVIYCAGGFGREVAWLIGNINKINPEWNILGFIDDVKTDLYGKKINNIDVLGGSEWFDSFHDDVFVACANGDSRARASIITKLEKYPNVMLATLIDPSVSIGDFSQIGAGSIICFGSRIMVNVTIGKGVVLNTGCAVGHDSFLKDFTTLLTNVMISGNVQVSEFTEIGSGVFVLQELTIAGDVVIAPLTSVLRSIDDKGIYSGNPARRIK